MNATFNLTGTPAEQDAVPGPGVLLLKDSVPQLFLPCPDQSAELATAAIRIDPAHAEEITATTDVFEGTLDAAGIFSPKRQLFPQQPDLSPLRRARIAAGLSVRALAEAAGTTANIVSLVENGKRIPRADTLRRLADALGVSMDELWPKA